MKITYTPADGDVQVYSFVPGDLLNHESEAIERRTDWTWVEFLDKLQKGSTLARRAALWTMQRRQHHTLRFEDVTFAQSQLSVEYDLPEMTAMRDAMAAAPERDGVDKDEYLSFMDAEIAKATPQDAPVDEGKAPEPTGVGDTASL